MALRYRRRNRPKRIILVRHGESGGNVDRNLYCSTPDSRITLTERGFAQGRAAGVQIRKLVGNETVRKRPARTSGARAQSAESSLQAAITAEAPESRWRKAA